MKPGTHADVIAHKVKAAQAPITRLHTKAGDAVVFDHRLLHRGVNREDASHNRSVTKGQRIAISLSFGKRDAFSEAFSRAFRMRGRVYKWKSDVCKPKREYDGLLDTKLHEECVYSAVRNDIKSHPMTGVPDGVPWSQERQQLSETASYLRDIEGFFRALGVNSALQPLSVTYGVGHELKGEHTHFDNSADSFLRRPPVITWSRENELDRFSVLFIDIDC